MNLSRKQKFLLNTIFSILLQIVTVVSGLILPRYFLSEYGSDVNGLISSISRFLSLISFLELGVGSVVTSSLYRPLAENNEIEVNKIITSGGRFFKRIAEILAAYIVILTCLYPFLVSDEFSWLFTATLIVAISISSFAQYYFGIIDRLLLGADQMGFVSFGAQIVTIIANLAASIILIKLKAQIQIVKLISSLIFLLQPLLLRLYINKKYKINRNEAYDTEPIKQKWNGIAQHIAHVVLVDSDTIVLTFFSSLKNVSIYGVYYSVINGVSQLMQSFLGGANSLIGNLWAKQEMDKLYQVFGCLEFLIHTLTVFLFTCTGILIVPFVTIYTKGITDANYIQPLFACILTIATGIHIIRTPYNVIILAGGHYKQTQKCYIIAAALNMGISILAVKIWGLVGVAIGTLVAMGYQTIWMAYYDSRNLIQWPFKKFLKQLLFDVLVVGLTIFATSWIKFEKNYLFWFVRAIEVAAITGIIIVLLSLLLYRERIREMKTLLLNR